MSYGLYCPQHGIWRIVDGLILHYSDESITRAHLNQLAVESEHFTATRLHLWEVTEIGNEKMVDMDTLPPASRVCLESVNPYLSL